MKYVKPLGLAAVAAMALMAFLGAGSASATVLCKTQVTEGCGATGWDYPSGTVVDASLEKTTTDETTGGTVIHTCTEGTLEFTTTNTGSSTSTVEGNINKFTFGNCTKTVDVLANGSIEIHWISGTDNGTLTGKNTKITTNSIFGSCVYGTAASGTHLGTLTATPDGSSMATIHIEALVPLIEGGGLCPASGRWTAAYTVTGPEPLHVSTS